MEKRHLLFGVVLLMVLVVGCAAQKVPEVVCRTPYIKNEGSCCMDQNYNTICDDDESGTLFEPDYTPSDKPVKKDTAVKDLEDDVFTEAVYEEPAKKDNIVVVEPDPSQVKTEVKKVASKYSTPEPKVNWYAETNYMSIKVENIHIEVKKIKPKDLISPDKEVWLKDIQFVIKNKKYNYLNPKISIRVTDKFDRLVDDTMLCDASDDLEMVGCNKALEEGKSMNVTMKIDTKMPRFDIEKKIWLVLENRRDPKTAGIIEIKKTVDILSIPGATY